MGRRRVSVRHHQAPRALTVIAAGGAVAGALPSDRDWVLLFLELVAYGARHPACGAALRELVVRARDAIAGEAATIDQRQCVESFAAAANGASVEALLDGDEQRAAGLLCCLADRLR